MRFCRRCRRPLGDQYRTVDNVRVCLRCANGIVDLEWYTKHEMQRMSWERRAQKKARQAQADKARKACA